MPIRIQRRRAWGWKMPPDTIYVGRPTAYGNPFLVTQMPREESLRRYQQRVARKLADNPSWLEPLRGKNLCCWCALDQPCHGDILLRLSNE